MLAVLRQRDFALLWCANVASVAGDWALLIALPIYVYSLTGSALATGGSFMASVLPRLLLGSVAGVFADRWNRQITMVSADVLRAALLPLLLAVNSVNRVWLVYAVLFLQAIASQFFNPAQGALFPKLVTPKQLVAANALDTLTSGIARLAGPPLGGTLMALTGIKGVIAVDSASFLVSGLLIGLISVSGKIATAPSADPSRLGSRWLSIWRDWREGLRLAVQERVLVAIFAADGMAMVEYGIVSVILVVFVRKTLGGGAVEYGLAAAAQGVGALLGSLAIGSVGERVVPIRTYGWSLVAMGIAIFAASNARSVVVLLPLLAVAGFCMVGWMVSARTLLQGAVPDAYRGRVLGAYGTTNAVLQLAGMALGSTLGDVVTPAWLLALAGLIDLMAGITAIVLLRLTPSRRETAFETADQTDRAGEQLHGS